MKLEEFHSAEIKQKWKIVRLDTHADVPGEIITADEANGAFSVSDKGETKTGECAAGIRIVTRKR